MKICGCDMAINTSCIYIYDHVTKKSNVLLMTDRKKLIKQKIYKKDLIEILFYDNRMPFFERIETIIEFISKNKFMLKICNIEGYSYGSVSNSMYQIGEFIGIFKYELYKNNIPYKIYAPMDLKKIATKNGTANKSMMFEHIHNKYIKQQLSLLSNHFKLKIHKNGISDITDAYHLSQIY